MPVSPVTRSPTTTNAVSHSTRRFRELARLFFPRCRRLRLWRCRPMSRREASFRGDGSGHTDPKLKIIRLHPDHFKKDADTNHLDATLAH